MQRSEQPRIELIKTKHTIDAMRNAKTLDEFEEYWKSFLNRLERVWNKASHYYGKSPKWNGWKGKYEHLRKKDPLLAYLINARGADEHTVNEIVTRKQGSIGISPAEGKGLYIKEMIIDRGKIFINSPQKIRIDFIPSKTKLLPVVNRGVKYNIPDSHMGKSINPENVIEVAKIGAGFYEKFLDDVEEYFVK